MIVNSKDLLLKAKKNKYAIPQFNINNLEWTKFILEECNLNNSPVIIGVSESSIKYMGGYKTTANIIRNLDEELNIKVPVVIHLDHGKSFKACKQAIDNGFTSVMIDASEKELEENIEITKQVVKYAEKFTVNVEAEIGEINQLKNYVSIEDTLKLIKETNIDSIAPALGNAHGIYKGQPNINYDLIVKLNENTNIPLVLHGGSGLSQDNLKKCIDSGITKINFNTDLQIAWSNALKLFLYKNGKEYDPRIIIKSGENEIKKVIKNKIDILKSNS